MEIEHLIHRGGAKTRDHTPRFGRVDRFNPGALKRQAQTQRHTTHAGRIEGIETDRLAQLRQLYAQADQRQTQRGQARTAFTRAVPGPRRSRD